MGSRLGLIQQLIKHDHLLEDCKVQAQATGPPSSGTAANRHLADSRILSQDSKSDDPHLFQDSGRCSCAVSKNGSIGYCWRRTQRSALLRSSFASRAHCATQACAAGSQSMLQGAGWPELTAKGRPECERHVRHRFCNMLCRPLGKLGSEGRPTGAWRLPGHSLPYATNSRACLGFQTFGRANYLSPRGAVPEG